MLSHGKLFGDRCLNHRSPLPVQGEAFDLPIFHTQPDSPDAIISENEGLALRRIKPFRGATLESDPDLEMFGVPAPTNRNLARFSRTCSSETSGLVCVFSPQTLGQPKRRHHPKLHHVVGLQQSKATPLTLLLFNPNTKVNCKSRENQGVNSWVSLK